MVKGLVLLGVDPQVLPLLGLRLRLARLHQGVPTNQLQSPQGSQRRGLEPGCLNQGREGNPNEPLDPFDNPFPFHAPFSSLAPAPPR